jgi:LysM repeat protein
VRSGETLSQIAGRYGTTVSALMRANGLRSANRLRVGQPLRVPARGAQATR